eukprot:TRINITY_DN4253_c0_g1_i1.p1 TRINITY_DN4253_c0_g1~~TRINITY_DN4253_c0_g1_i1.p1  ORF type:complete len:80 (-),score=9.05 TRINITY_DN4253_c0_g1_i1:186-425(-)
MIEELNEFEIEKMINCIGCKGGSAVLIRKILNGVISNKNWEKNKTKIDQANKFKRSTSDGTKHTSTSLKELTNRLMPFV